MTINTNTASIFAKVMDHLLLQAKGMMDTAVRGSTKPYTYFGNNDATFR